MTAYERLGGDAAIAGLLEGLYTRGLADPELAPFLQNIDMERLRKHQFAFISQALGGPHQYSIPSLAQAHVRLRIEQRHFDLFIGHLRESLRDVGAKDELIEEIMAGVVPLAPVIVNTPSGMSQAG